MSNNQKKRVFNAITAKNLGVEFKTQKYKRDKEKREFTYLSKKQLKKLCEANDSKAFVDGYTKVRKYKDETDAALLINRDAFDVYKKKRFFCRTAGYIRTQQNVWVALQKSLAWILIPIFLMALFIGIAVFHPDSIDTIAPWFPVIDENIGNEPDTPEQPKGHTGIQVDGFTAWNVPAGKTDGLTIPLKNPEGNPCYFTFKIVLTDTEEEIYESKMVPPGEKISKINISRPLEKGTYDAVIMITTNELETGREMNSPALRITINVT